MTQVSSGLDQLVAARLELIEHNQTRTGAYVAGPCFPTYQYSWLRDGAFIADAMSRHGHTASAERFHGWCARIISDRRDQIAGLVTRGRARATVDPGEHLHTRYTVDGQEASGFWENFQLDGYGTWLWSLRLHRDRHCGGAAVLADEVGSVVAYLATFWSEPSYDWWEEHLGYRHTSTLASIWAGLNAVATWDEVAGRIRSDATEAAAQIVARIDQDAVVSGGLVKWLGGDQVDASLVACFTPFDLYPLDHPVTVATIARIERELAPSGVYRYLDDVYYGGGQWVLLTAFLGWHHARAGNVQRAHELLGWIVDQADEHGALPEQVANGLLHPEHLEPWQDKWGPSARPLLWSHAMLLELVAALDLDAGHLP